MTSDWIDSYLLISAAVLICIACYDGRDRVEPGMVVFVSMLWPVAAIWAAGWWLVRRIGG